MKTSFLTTLICSTLIIFTGCQTKPIVDYDQSAAAQIAQYDSFSIISPEKETKTKTAILSPIVDRRIMRSIQDTLVAKGFKPSENNPDFEVYFATTTKTRTELERVSIGFSPYRRHPFYGSFSGDRFITSEYMEGSFIIDIIDTVSEELIWRGIYEERLGTKAPNDEDIEKIVDAILKNFPPQ